MLESESVICDLPQVQKRMQLRFDDRLPRICVLNDKLVFDEEVKLIIGEQWFPIHVLD